MFNQTNQCKSVVGNETNFRQNFENWESGNFFAVLYHLFPSMVWKSIPNAYFLSRTVIRRCWFSCCEFVSARLLISNFPHVRNFALISVVFRSLWLDSFYRIICRFFKAELFFWSSILKLDLEQCFLDLLFFPQSFHDTFFVSIFIIPLFATS